MSDSRLDLIGPGACNPSHPDEALPRAETWLKERANWEDEVRRQRDCIRDLEARLAAAHDGTALGDALADLAKAEARNADLEARYETCGRELRQQGKTFMEQRVKAEAKCAEHVIARARLENMMHGHFEARKAAEARVKVLTDALELIRYTHKTATDPLPPAGEWVLSVVENAIASLPREPRCVTCNDTGEAGAVSGFPCPTCSLPPAPSGSERGDGGEG